MPGPGPSLAALWLNGIPNVAAAVELAATLATIPFVLLSRKGPQAKLGWLLALATLPYVGLFFYWLLGRDWLNRRVLRLRHARGQSLEPTDRMLVSTIKASLPSPRPGVGAEIVLAAEMEGVAAPYRGNSVRPLADGPSAFEAARVAVDSARDHVNVLTYIFKDDRTGRGVIERLVAAARRGVQVRLLFDALGTYHTSRRLFRPLIDAGGRVAAFLPLAKGLRSLRVNLRNHRKIMVVDGRVAFTGGMNVADEYAEASGWRDVHARIEGPAALGLQRVFVEDWHFATGELLDAERWFAPVAAEGDVPVQVLAAGPDLATPVIENLFFAAVAAARRRIDILTPYFVPPEPLEAVIADAARRGRHVRVLLPEHVDHRLVGLASDTVIPRLMAEGVEFFGYPKMLHGKVMVIDDAWSTLGSANMDARSLRLNFEVNVAFPDAPTSRLLRGLIDKEIAISRRFTADDFRFGLGGRLLRNSAALLAPVL